jgi:hypothetical protein
MDDAEVHYCCFCHTSCKSYEVAKDDLTPSGKKIRQCLVQEGGATVMWIHSPVYCNLHKLIYYKTCSSTEPIQSGYYLHMKSYYFNKDENSS